MNGDPTAILMAVSSTRRNLHEPPRASRPRRSRRATARALQALAFRLDPGVAQQQELQLS